MFYYKKKDGTEYLSSWSKIEGDDYVEITEEEFNAKIHPQPSEKEIAKRQKLARIRELKIKLANTDYQAIKYAEGLISDKDYASIKSQRQSWRDEINNLESKIK